jgi:hypothetical protein
MSEIANVEAPHAESREERLSKALAALAKTHLDLLMGAKEWNDLGVASLFPKGELPTGFHWTIYVNPDRRKEGGKRIGIKLFNASGCLDVLEFSSPDSTLPLSDQAHQNLIDEEMNAPAKAENERRKKAHEEAVAKAERERGFPSGSYEISADFPIHGGRTHHLVMLSSFPVKELDTYNDVWKRAQDQAVGQGLHNYSLTYLEDKGYAVVTVNLRRPGLPDIAFEFKIDPTGHVPREDR